MPRQAQLLLVDPHSLFRRTVALVARQLQVAEVHECSSHDAAQRLLEFQPMDGLLVDIGGGLDALALVQSVRAGALRCPPAMPIALTAEACDVATAQLYKELEIRRIMLKPFKVKTALEVIQDLAGLGPPSRFAPTPEGRHPSVRETLTKGVAG
ncbi:Response regulator receiver domain-containing protein [Roseateles sp. YR242]|uniref:response regulator n=1 Tax=Roseateles sp. YR242 TaxID=1855305 RepID=UPI0008BCBCF9|nr:response regulator [Roseateles sp. YR242]SEK86714.1 Response regulator receiver domain-containing protein [Roseateles sp. YR242]